MRNHFYFVLHLLMYVLPGIVSAQQATESFRHADISPPPVFPGPEEITNKREWNWQFLGPSVQPKELNPGGSAIPAYAVNRGNGTGRINFLFIHPNKHNRAWACSPTGGLWYTRDEGENWNIGGTDKLPISGVSSVTVNPRNSNHWIIGTGDCDDLFMFTNGVWRTKNRGKSWENINGSDSLARLPFNKEGDVQSFICKVASHPKDFNIVMVASNNGLFITRNGRDKKSKIKWKKVADGYFYDIEFIVNQKSFSVFASGDKMYGSYDSGNTFEELPKPEYKSPEKFPFLRISMEFSPDRQDVLTCAVTCSHGPSMSAIGEATLQEFDIRTRTWKLIRSLEADDMNNMIPTRARAIAVSPIDKDYILCGNIQPVYYSQNGGLNFNKIESRQMHDDIHHLEFSADGKTVWAGHDGGVSLSRDGGLHWETRDNGIGAANVFGLSVAQSYEPRILYGGYDTGGNLLKDGEWYHVSWGDGFESIIDKTNPDVMITSKQNGSLNKSVDGKSFERGISPPASGTEWHTWIRQNSADNKTIYCAGSRLMRSTSLGEEWETMVAAKDLGPELYNCYRFFLSEEHPSVMYVYVLDETKVHPQIWRSFNISEPLVENIRWEKVADIPHEGWIIGIEVDPEDPNRFWMLYNMYERTGKIWYFNGNEYEDYTANLGFSKTESIVLQKGRERRLYVGTNYGVFTRSAREDQWTLLTGLPGTFIKSLAINYTTRKLVVGTFGRGIWTGDLVGS